MALPLHEQLRHEEWRRMINSAGPGDLERLQELALRILDYAAAHRAFALGQLQSALGIDDDAGNVRTTPR